MRPSERCLRGAARPPALADLPEPPEVLYLRGELARAPAVAIIGTRAPSPGALGYTRSLASALGRAGVTIVSGGAVGIDAAAHEGALDAGGSCLVVAPSGYERPFPRENAPLFRAVVERGGAYLSLVPGDVPASRGAFFLRNAVLVALADLVILVEAPYRSGARNAAAAARRLGRPLLVAPSPPWNPPGAGAAVELRLGARALESPRQVLRLLAERGLHPLARRAAPPPPLWRPAPGAARAPACGAPRARAPGRAAARVPAGAPARDARGGGDAPPCRRAGPGSAPSRQEMMASDGRAGRDRDAGPARPAELPESARDPARERVLERLRAGAVYADELCAELGLSVARLQELLLTLTLEGVLVADLSGRLMLRNT